VVRNAVLLKEINYASTAETELVGLPALAAASTTVTLGVQNMTCPACPITVKKSLEKVSGVSDVQVNLDQKTAIVIYDPVMIQLETLIEATTNAGSRFPVFRKLPS
tara:strand:+ start:23308 stop:23625 length:318 start_codon:yes stop_codon:yes gene_type:complete